MLSCIYVHKNFTEKMAHVDLYDCVHMYRVYVKKKSIPDFVCRSLLAVINKVCVCET